MTPVNIYLDVDGVLITKKGTPALHLHEFAEFVTSRYPTFWLTTHCKGDSRDALAYLMARDVEDKTIEVLHKVAPTNWLMYKTEAIDWRSDFLWFDDTPFENEMEYLEKKGLQKSFVLVDLNKNPDQLLEFVQNFPLPKET